MDTRRWRSLLRKQSTASLDSQSSISIYSRTTGLYTPNLPHELWLLIFRFAATDDSDDADGFCPYVYKRSKYAMGAHQSLTHSFLTHPPAHTHFPERLARYNAQLKWKASLTRVCRVFNLLAQEVLFQEVWISSSKDGRRMAARLGGAAADPTPMGVVSTVISAPKKQKRWLKRGKDKKKEVLPVERTITHRRSCSAFPKSQSNDPGRFIRHLRLETSSLDKCSPHDLLLVLQHCPMLSIFEDCRSIRRPMHPLIVSSSEVVPFSSSNTLTTDALSQAIISRPLKQLVWTNYSHDSQDFDRSVQLYSDLVAPLLGKSGQELEVLEVVNCADGFGMGMGRNSWGISKRLTTLDYSMAHTGHLPPSSLTLPSLRSLKVTLDNATFAILSTWSIPVLRNLSVISVDFGYSAQGFQDFFSIHGPNIRQLELGHSSGDVEEFWLTEQPQPQHQGRFRIPLEAWCPNLKEFICSADAEWNWQSPDWIAPHVLLPAHPCLEFIGIKGIERRLMEDLEESIRRRESHSNDESDEEDPYFMLMEQFGSLLQIEAFPSLRYIRDMSWESDVVRRTGRMHLHNDTPQPPSAPSTSATQKPLSKGPRAQLDLDRPRLHGSKVLRYWMAVLDKCRERGVWLEDWRGVNVTMGDLKRTKAGVL